MTKQCTKCKENKSVNVFTKRTANTENGGYGCWCKDCHNAHGKQDRINNPEKYKQWHKNWESNNKEKRLEINKNFRKTDKFKKWIKPYMKTQWKNAVDNLSDYYVKHSLSKRTSLQNKDIPDELIEIKREQLKILRFLRNDKALQ